MDFDLFISSLLDEKESYDLEYKSAEGGFPGSFWDTYSSLPIHKVEPLYLA